MYQEKATERIELRVTEDLKNRALKRASEENRSLSNFVINLVTDYLNDIDNAKFTLNKSNIKLKNQDVG